MENKNFKIENNISGMCAAFIEPRINHEASDFMSEHITEIYNQARKMGVDPDKVCDLVNDVWVSIREAEENGNGYDPAEYADEGDFITVAEFVYGRIKGYSRNNRYHSEFSERRVNKDPTKCVEVISASVDSDELDDLNAFQKAYATAASEDDMEVVELEASLRESIEYCIGFDEMVGFSIVGLLKNIELFADETVSNSLFDKLKETIKYHNEFGTAFQDVLTTAVKYRPVFDAVMASF